GAAAEVPANGRVRHALWNGTGATRSGLVRHETEPQALYDVRLLSRPTAPTVMTSAPSAGNTTLPADVVSRKPACRAARWNGPAALTVAQARHDDRTGDHPCPLLLRPADRFEERPGVVLFPVGEQQFRLRSQRVNHLGTQDAVLAIACLQVTVLAKRADSHL